MVPLYRARRKKSLREKNLAMGDPGASRPQDLARQFFLADVSFASRSTEKAQTNYIEHASSLSLFTILSLQTAMGFKQLLKSQNYNNVPNN